MESKQFVIQYIDALSDDLSIASACSAYNVVIRPPDPMLSSKHNEKVVNTGSPPSPSCNAPVVLVLRSEGVQRLRLRTSSFAFQTRVMIVEVLTESVSGVPWVRKERASSVLEHEEIADEAKEEFLGIVCTQVHNVGVGRVVDRIQDKECAQVRVLRCILICVLQCLYSGCVLVLDLNQAIYSIVLETLDLIHVANAVKLDQEQAGAELPVFGSVLCRAGEKIFGDANSIVVHPIDHTLDDQRLSFR